MSAVIMKKLFLIGSIVVIIAGALMTFLGVQLTDLEGMYSIMGPIVMIVGILFLLTGIFAKGVAETSQSRIFGIIMILGGILGVGGVFGSEIGGTVSLVGAIFILLVFFIWPCLCCQGQKNITSQVIGVASSHERISIGEMSNITGLDETTVKRTIYDTIGKGRLSGKMEGDTFVRSLPSTTAYSTPTTTTREREIVKVLVICPFCGAKTEQGIGKCQNCGADL